jgi:beta-glucosidase
MIRPFYFIFIAGFITLFSCNNKEAYLNTNLGFEERAADLVSRMTLEEKVAQMQNEAPAIERLGVPAHDWWNECLHGVARSGLATVFPQAIGMAAMWDDAEMFAIANTISDEARAKHHDYAARGKRGMNQGLSYWTPNINIFRDPRWGRGQETYGEDPYLSGELAVDFIKGLQGDDPRYLKLVATIKHFAVHSGPEATRRSANVLPNNYDLYDTYLPHFKKTVEQAHVYSAMCAYQRLNDLPCCGNPFLSDLLRNEWGFDGYIVSDCGGISYFYEHHKVAASLEEAAAMAVKAGTDLNCGSTYTHLTTAVEKGLITEAEIDVAVKRLMIARMKLGQFDPPEKVPYSKIPLSVVDSKEHRELALDAARKSIVLLKNEKQLLPFSKNVKKIAVIGPNADDSDGLLGNYHGSAPYLITPLQAIREKLPAAEVSFALGCPLDEGKYFLQTILNQYLFTDNSLKENGLKGEYFENKKWEGTPAYTRIDSAVNFQFYGKAPFEDANKDHYSIKWTGVLVPPVNGEYAIGAEGFSGYEIFIDDQSVTQWDGIYDPEKKYKLLQLEGGRPYAIRIEYFSENSSQSIIRLLWNIPNSKLEQEAIDIARNADLIVLCMGINISVENEGRDRKDIQLPAIQQQLIRKIQQIGKPIVLVLNNGSAIAINREADNISAIIEAWYPGQSGGTAVADVIFGDYNPAGRLPVTFYRSIDQLPDYTDFDMEGRTYRYFRGKPLYEFGYGLSYTTFAYEIENATKTFAPDKPVEIAVKVTNTGKYDGDEVAQLYVTLPESGYRTPIRSLQGFKRIHLKTGETQTIRFTLQPEQLQTRDDKGFPVMPLGEVLLSIGGKQPDEQALASKQVIQTKIRMIEAPKN